jgi:dTMP kinase
MDDIGLLPIRLWKEVPSQLPGRLIVVEGFDGSGKSTQIERLAEALKRRGHRVLATRQPTDWYRNDPNVRSFLDDPESTHSIKALALLAAADRLRHCAEVIEPALHDGYVVLCDRYVYSSIALFMHRGLHKGFIELINSGIPQPDWAFYLSVPCDILLKRITQRDGDKRKREERSLTTISEICELYENVSHGLLSIDGTQDIDTLTRCLLRHLAGISDPIDLENDARAQSA